MAPEKADNCSFRHDINKRAKMTQPNSSPNSFMQQNERNASRTRSPRGKSPSGRMSRWPCKDFLHTNSFCKKWPLQNACSTRPRAVANMEKSAHVHIVDEQPSKKSKTNDEPCGRRMINITKDNNTRRNTGNRACTNTTVSHPQSTVTKSDSQVSINHGMKMLSGVTDEFNFLQKLRKGK